MELHQALKAIIETNGSGIIKDIRLINILSDYKAYEDTPAAKYLIKNMINEGVMTKFIMEYQTNGIDNLLITYKKSLAEIYGYKDSLAEYVLNCVAFALGWINDIPSSNPSANNLCAVDSSNPVGVDIIDDGQHLLFKQFPINGDANTFIRQLTSSGYTLKEPYNREYHGASLRGSFAGKTDCYIGVVGTPKSHIACGVLIMLDKHHIWYSIKNEYETFKNQLTKKYGSPEVYEFFSDPYCEGDGYELTALSCQHCTYISKFVTPVGAISVSMTSDAKVMIFYQDDINSKISDEEAQSIANDDL